MGFRVQGLGFRVLHIFAWSFLLPEGGLTDWVLSLGLLKFKVVHCFTFSRVGCDGRRVGRAVLRVRVWGDPNSLNPTP